MTVNHIFCLYNFVSILIHTQNIVLLLLCPLVCMLSFKNIHLSLIFSLLYGKTILSFSEVHLHTKRGKIYSLPWSFCLLYKLKVLSSKNIRLLMIFALLYGKTISKKVSWKFILNINREKIHILPI